jgi:hypothetical protein
VDKVWSVAAALCAELHDLRKLDDRNDTETEDGGRELRGNPLQRATPRSAVTVHCPAVGGPRAFDEKAESIGRFIRQANHSLLRAL